ncbi:tetratricopeptide repeat-containing sensor histidine kinase [Winogradskyella immobilis]|uniref:histidine kinase n=1 Tax=Winogradskyella immobilis TaxID=2816852 RepID=A0ABS8EM67_9FLAO|nr:tetratricopeptide repeat protein [Winogradskyella immobilis]MCC1484314.1 tetratricopeptide repeat protein [Winogradskyella immobilis]MCG0016406.1 tetratricopeptide repeat protein [Winogradskyella immobilis]
MKRLLFFVFIIPIIMYSQNTQVDSLSSLLKTTTNTFELVKLNLQLASLHERLDLNKGKSYAYNALKYKSNDSLLAETNNQLGRFHFFTGQLDSALHYFRNSKTLLIGLNDQKRAAIINISLGAIQLRQGDYEKTITTLTQSASFFEDTKDELNAAKCYSNIASAFAELEIYPKAIEYSKKALIVFENQNQTQFRLITLPNLATQYYKNGDTIKAIDYNNKAEQLASKVGDKRSLSIIYNNLGDLYLEKDINKAKQYLEKTLQLKNELNLKSGIEITQSNLGYIHLKNKDYKTAISFFKKAEQLIRGKQRVNVYNNLRDTYKGLGQMNSALEYSEKSSQLNDSILNIESQKSFIEIQTKYETEKKEKEILQLKTENLEVNYRRKQNRNLLLGSLIALFTAIFGLYMVFKNAKRKRIIMEQNLTIQQQEFNDLLKSQELDGIDAIIDAQEQERSTMAADLHDNLGSKVATLKLYLESYDDKEAFSGFYNKLKKLMNDTYIEIRNISKNKNFGAQINKGLIPSTKIIAKRISDSKKIDIKVINVDVKTRIENTLEIQIFRIIQELLTNIIKHAEATEAIVQFSEHENILNIIVEDNGKGFNIDANRHGVGLTNIEKRAEKIDAELVVDSGSGNGTTIILNIPL